MIKKTRPPRIFYDNRGPFVILSKKKKKVKKYINTNIEKSILTNIFINSQIRKKAKKRRPGPKSMKMAPIDSSAEDLNLPKGLRDQLALLRMRNYVTQANPIIQALQKPLNINLVTGQMGQPGTFKQVQLPGPAPARPARRAPAPPTAPAPAPVPAPAPIRRIRALTKIRQFRAPTQVRPKLQLFSGPAPAMTTGDPGPIQFVAPGQPGPTIPKPPLVDLVENAPIVITPGKEEAPIETQPAQPNPNLNVPAPVSSDPGEPVPGEDKLGYELRKTVDDPEKQAYTFYDVIGKLGLTAVGPTIGVNFEMRQRNDELEINRAILKNNKGKILVNKTYEYISKNPDISIAQAKNHFSKVILPEFQSMMRTPVGYGKVMRGLWDFEIDQMMAPYKKYGWLGCVSADQLGALNPGRHRIVSFIVNTSRAKDPGKHWCAGFVDARNDKSANFFDSYGKDPSPEIAAGLKHLVDKMNPRTLLRYRINRVRAQSWSTDTCGWHCVRWLLDMYAGAPFAACTGFDKIINNVKEGEARVGALKKKIKKFGYI
ncbi:MAG: hypothetical protein ACYC3F_16710 [Gemmatimonadaceae bacterium]